MAGRSTRVGRPRALSAKAFRAGVEAYFRKISFEKPLTRDEPMETVDENGIVRPMLDEHGHVLKRRVAVKDMDGNPITRTEYAEAPGISALCLDLGIDKATFTRYASAAPGENLSAADAKIYRASAEWAKARIEAYLEAKLGEKNNRGVIFNLQENYGWKNRSEITVRGGVEEYLKSLEDGVEY